MTSGDPTGPRAARCRYLRWKAYYTGLAPDPLQPDVPDDLCWCVMTQRCLGPDGALADHRDCRPGRECFEAAARRGRS